MKGFLAFVALLVFIGPLYADSSSAPSPKESQLVEHGHYVNKSGHTVHSPAHTKSGEAPPGATAKCGDGSYSFSQHHRGTCSHHRGVVSWIG